MTFLAKTCGEEAAPAATTWSMFLVLAEANTSAGAPDVIWVARAELAAKLKVTFTPGWAASNCWPSVVKESFSEAAAKTVIPPESEAEVEVDGEAEADVLAAPLEPVLDPPEPQPARPTPTRPAVRVRTRRRMSTP